MIYTRGTPRKHRGNHLHREEINYTRKTLVYGNSCKVNALFNKGAHPCPSLFEESSVHLNTSKTIGRAKETKTIKEVKATTIKTIEKTKRKNDCQTHVGQSGHGSESCVCCLFVGFLDGV